MVCPFDEGVFDAPFCSISDDPVPSVSPNYPLRGDGGILQALPGRPELDPGDFPRSIRHFLWAEYSADAQHGRSWHLLCQLDNGHFALFTAATPGGGGGGGGGGAGFGTGSMALHVAADAETLVFFCMSDYEYGRYTWATAPAPSWAARDAETAARRLAWAMLAHPRLGARAALWARALGPDMLGRVGGLVRAVPIPIDRAVHHDQGSEWFRA